VAAILVVEDEVQVLILAESYLEEHGHSTLSAATVTQATAIIEDDQPLTFCSLTLAWAMIFKLV
jgi:CheY-like chemotaxis protein